MRVFVHIRKVNSLDSTFGIEKPLPSKENGKKASKLSWKERLQRVSLSQNIYIFLLALSKFTLNHLSLKLVWESLIIFLKQSFRHYLERDVFNAENANRIELNIFQNAFESGYFQQCRVHVYVKKRKKPLRISIYQRFLFRKKWKEIFRFSWAVSCKRKKLRIYNDIKMMSLFV